jgi:diaminopimelate decarboxylase
VAVEALARRYGTPLYVYSQHTLTEHFQALDRALNPFCACSRGSAVDSTSSAVASCSA